MGGLQYQHIADHNLGPHFIDLRRIEGWILLFFLTKKQDSNNNYQLLLMCLLQKVAVIAVKNIYACTDILLTNYAENGKKHWTPFLDFPAASNN